MRRILLFWLVAAGFSLQPLLAQAKSIRIVTTTEDLASIAKEIGKEKTEVTFLARGMEDPHYVQVRPSDMIKVSRADIVVMVGLELDGWISPVIDGSRNRRVRPGEAGFVDASVGIEPLEVPQGKVDRSMGDVHPRGNPHYWLNPMNGKMIAKNILESLVRLRPWDEKFFRANYESFCARLDQKITHWKEIARPLQGLKVITYHKSWSYFASAMGLEVVNFVEPRAGIPPTPRHLQDLMTQMKSDKISLLISEPYFDARLPEKVSRETGAKLVILSPSVGALGVKDYFDLFDQNIQKIMEAVR